MEVISHLNCFGNIIHPSIRFLYQLVQCTVTGVQSLSQKLQAQKCTHTLTLVMTLATPTLACFWILEGNHKTQMKPQNDMGRTCKLHAQSWGKDLRPVPNPPYSLTYSYNLKSPYMQNKSECIMY